MPLQAPAVSLTAPMRTRSIYADPVPARKKSMLSMHPFRFFPATTSAFRSATFNLFDILCFESIARRLDTTCSAQALPQCRLFAVQNLLRRGNFFSLLALQIAEGALPI